MFLYHEFQEYCALPVYLDGEPFAEASVIIHTLPSVLKDIIPKKMAGNLLRLI